MKSKTLLLLLTLGLAISPVFSQQLDTSKTISPPAFTDSIIQLSLSLFTANQTLASADIDNLVLQDFASFLKGFRQLDLFRGSSISQINSFGLFGHSPAGAGILSGQFFFNPPGLSPPSQNSSELNLIPIENIQSIRLIENPLLNLILADSRTGGIFLEEKDYLGGEPYSRLTFEQGIWGYKRTQVELGRGFRSKLRFYGTLGIHKYAGELPHNLQDLDNYTFRLSYDLDSKTRVSAGTQIHSGKREVTTFPGIEAESLKVKQGYQKFNLTLYRSGLKQSVLKASFDFARVKQELKPIGWESVDKLYGLRLDFYPEKLGRNNTKLSWNVYKYDYNTPAKNSQEKDNFSLTNLLQITPKFWWLVWANLEGIDSTGEFFINRRFSFLTGLAFQADSSLRFYTSAGKVNLYPGLKDYYNPSRFLYSDTTPIYSESGNLNPRTGYHWYVQSGIDWEKEKIKTGTYFYLANSKRAITVARQDTLLYGSYMPVNTDIETYGGNLYLDFHPLSAIRLYSNFSYKHWQKGRASYLPKASNYSFIELDQNFFRNQLGWKVKLEAEYLGRRFDENKSSLDEVMVLNARLGIRLLAANFYFVIQNLTNQTYKSASQFNQPERNNWWGFYWEFFD